MIGTPVDHTALSLSGAYSSDCSFNCAALQRKHRELDWGGKWGIFCIFLFVRGGVSNGENKERNRLAALHTSN